MSIFLSLSKLVIISLLFSLLFLHSIHADDNHPVEPKEGGVGKISPTPTTPQKMDCGGACEGRCRLSSRPRLCKRACGTCCQRCNCVPPGTWGNHNLCPCYAAMTTHGGRLKCP